MIQDMHVSELNAINWSIPWSPCIWAPLWVMLWVCWQLSQR